MRCTILALAALLLTACTTEDVYIATTFETASEVALNTWADNMGPVSDACADVVARAEVSRVSNQGAMDYACPEFPGALACTEYQGEGKPGRPMPVIVMGPVAGPEVLVHEYAHILSACELHNADAHHEGAAWEFFLKSGPTR